MMPASKLLVLLPWLQLLLISTLTSTAGAFQSTITHRMRQQKYYLYDIDILVSRSQSTQQNHPLSASSADDFDPLRSPHDYPNGTGDKSSKSKSQETGTNDKVVPVEEDEEDWSPLKMKSVKNDFQGAATDDYSVTKSTFTRDWSAVSATSSASGSISISEEEYVETRNKVVDFDPLISPHSYAKGTDQGPVAVQSKSNIIQKQTVGVLLIDHGSKRSTSNQRLEKLRDIYQDRSPDHYSVKAAHMEIAEPSIQHQIREFCNEGVETIVCHPYFLSPGRHVLEDIPELIQEAIEVMKEEGVEDLEVLTTDPVGSNMDLMVGLIGTIVDEALGVDGEEEFESGFVEKEQGSLGGFFGEVQRMLDEQL